MHAVLDVNQNTVASFKHTHTHTHNAFMSAPHPQKVLRNVFMIWPFKQIFASYLRGEPADDDSASGPSHNLLTIGRPTNLAGREQRVVCAQTATAL